jgi:Double zinc ribbon
VSDVRCRACGASIPADAQWCNLCFTPLAEVRSIRERVSVPAALPDPEADVAPLLPPVPRSVTTPTTLAAPTMPSESVTLPASAPLTPVAPSLNVDSAAWPCPRCGEQVGISLDTCPTCGAGFLDGASAELSTKVPMLGDFGTMTSGQRWLTAFGLAIGLIVAFVVLAFIIGNVF